MKTGHVQPVLAIVASKKLYTLEYFIQAYTFDSARFPLLRGDLHICGNSNIQFPLGRSHRFFEAVYYAENSTGIVSINFEYDKLLESTSKLCPVEETCVSPTQSARTCS